MGLTLAGVASMGKMKPESKMDGTMIKIAMNMACCWVFEMSEMSKPKEIITAT